MKLRLMLALAASAVACVALSGGAPLPPVTGTAVLVFSGEVLAAPGAERGSISVQVETGNHAALKALIGAAPEPGLHARHRTRVS